MGNKPTWALRMLSLIGKKLAWALGVWKISSNGPWEYYHKWEISLHGWQPVRRVVFLLVKMFIPDGGTSFQAQKYFAEQNCMIGIFML